jgi:hypothetical protein
MGFASCRAFARIIRRSRKRRQSDMSEQSKHTPRANDLASSRSSAGSDRSGRRSAASAGTNRPRGGTGGAGAVASRALGQVSRALEKKMAKPGGDLGKLAKSLKLTSEQLEGNAAAPYVEKLATGLERLSSAMGELDTEKAKQSVERFARRRPWLFLSGAVGLGFVGARFLKSSTATVE